MHIRFFFLSLVLFSFLITSCRQSLHPGYEKTSGGLYYRFHRENDSGRKPKPGEVLFCHMSLSLKTEEGDSLLYTSEQYPDLPGGIRLLPLDSNYFKGDIAEGLAMMKTGDSASFIVNADSFFLKRFQLEELPPEIRPGSELVFEIGLVEVQSEDETRRRIMALASQERAANHESLKQLEEEEPATLQRYLETKQIKEKPTNSGLIYMSTLAGNGPKVKKGQKVTVHYTGYLLNGKKFDSSFDHDQPFVFTLGQGEVIAGWDEGIALMRVGGSATLIVPSQLAYGSNGRPPVIPPFSPLVFDVQLINAE